MGGSSRPKVEMDEQAPPCPPHTRRGHAAMHTPGMVLHVRGLRGHHEKGWRVMPPCLQGSPQVSGDLPQVGHGHVHHAGVCLAR